MFVTSLPLLFTFTTLINPLELGLLFAAVFALLIPATPKPGTNYLLANGNTLYNHLYGAWTGKVMLWSSFWPFFILANVVFYYIDYRIGNVSYTINSWKTVHMMMFLPSVWWTVSVWRCSTHTQYKLFACAARAATVYFYFDFVLRLVLSVQYPETLFDCRLLVIEYGDCQ